MAAIAAVLVWQVVSRSLVAYLATVSPHAALSLRPASPSALLALAEADLTAEARRKAETESAPPAAARQSDGDADTQLSGDRLHSWASLAGKALDKDAPADPAPDQVRAWTELALSKDPFSARALRIMGQLAERAGDADRTASFMHAAAARSLRESTAHHWIMQQGFAIKDYATAMRAADTLLRTRSQLEPYVMSVLARATAHRAANDQLKALLAEAPPWRSTFLQWLPSAVSDPNAPLDLLLSLRDTKTPAARVDLREYLAALVRQKHYELAYYAWLQFLPAEELSRMGLLSNGSFEVAPSGLPFDWSITPGAGVSVEIAERPDQPGEHALLVEFGQGRVEFRGVSQLTMLSSGTYRFKGQYKGEVVGRRGLKWRVTCAVDNARPLGESAMMLGTQPEWTDVGFSFTVPAGDCRAQYVRLDLDARSASEFLVSGASWHDELAIVRLK